jgi:hypothetical protein
LEGLADMRYWLKLQMPSYFELRLGSGRRSWFNIEPYVESCFTFPRNFSCHPSSMYTCQDPKPNGGRGENHSAHTERTFHPDGLPVIVDIYRTVSSNTRVRNQGVKWATHKGIPRIMARPFKQLTHTTNLETCLPPKRDVPPPRPRVSNICWPKSGKANPKRERKT